MNSTRAFKQNWLRYVAIALAIVFFLAAALFIIRIWENTRTSFSGEVPVSLDQTVEYNGGTYTLKEDIETFLVLGLDKFRGKIDDEAYNNDRQADFLLLLVFDNKNETVSALQINRDTIAEINILGVAGEVVGKTEKQIALAHTYGNGREVSCRNTSDAVSKLLHDVKIDKYISLTLDAVPIINDSVDGVTLEVLDDFTGIDDSLVKGETVTLYGEHALNYVRTRYMLDDSTNIARMDRQRQYIRELYKKFSDVAATNDELIVRVLTDISDYMVSDCTITRLQSYYDKVSGYKFDGIYRLEGESVQGERFMEFHPDSDSVLKNVVELFYELKD